MRLIVCAATKFEIEGTLAFLEKHPRIKSETQILITGVGLMAATYLLTRTILEQRPSLVLQAGICGSLDETIGLGEIVAVRNENIGDLGVVEGETFHSIIDLGFLTQNETPWVKGKLPNNCALLGETGVRIVNGVTVNEITTDTKRIVFYKEQLSASIESMEGAALHYVCLMEEIPFLQLRSVSNYVGERDKNRWALTESISKLNKELERILLKLFTT